MDESEIGYEVFVLEGKIGHGTGIFSFIEEPVMNGLFLIAIAIGSNDWFGHGDVEYGALPLAFESFEEVVLFAVHWVG